jgi:hypothetical protein
MKSSSESSDAYCLVCGKAVDHGGGFCRLAIGDVMVALCCPLCLDTFNGDKLRFEAKLRAKSAGLLDSQWFTP